MLSSSQLAWGFDGHLAESYAGLYPLFINSDVSYTTGPFQGTSAAVFHTPLLSIYGGYYSPAYWIQYALPSDVPLVALQSQGGTQYGIQNVNIAQNMFNTFGSNAFSFAAWVNVNGSTYPDQGAISLQHKLNDYPDVNFQYNGIIGFNGSSSGLHAPANTWYLTSATFTAAEVTVYFNGVATGTFPFTETRIAAIRFGAADTGFNGAIALAQMWPVALSANQHASLAAAQAPFPQAPPAGAPPPPATPLLVNGFIQLANTNPPAVKITLTGPYEVVIPYDGYCTTEYAEQDAPGSAWRATDGTIILNLGNEQGNYRMIRTPQAGPILMSQFVRDCSRPPFVGTNTLPTNLDKSGPYNSLFPALFASPWDAPGCSHYYLNATYFGNYSPNMFMSATWAMPDVISATSGTVYGFGQNDICGGGHSSGPYGSAAGLISTDGGTSYSYVTGPDPAPGVFVGPTQSDTYNLASSVVQYPNDPNTWYIMAGTYNLNCVWKSTNIADTSAWRGWNGSDWSVKVIDPFTNTGPAPQECVPPANFGQAIKWSTVCSCWISIGSNYYGFSYSTSTNLTTWSNQEYLTSQYNPANPVAATYNYLTLIDLDNANADMNYVQTSSTPHLFVRYTNPVSQFQTVRFPLLVERR